MSHRPVSAATLSARVARLLALAEEMEREHAALFADSEPLTFPERHAALTALALAAAGFRAAADGLALALERLQKSRYRH